MSASSKAEIGFFSRLSHRTLGLMVSWVGGAPWRRAVVLTLIACAVLAPGLAAFGPTDRDEARFIQATKQMVASGDYVDIRFQDEARHQKPIGAYWAQSAAVNLYAAATGADAGAAADAPVWVYRLPSLIAGVLAALLTSWAVRPLVGARAAFLAGVMTAGLLVLSFEARTAKADALLLASVVAAQGALARLWFGVKDGPVERGWNVFYFWTALAVGFLVKGPLILLPVAGVLLWMSVWSKSLSGFTRLGAPWGVIWLLLLVAPWFVAVGVQTGGAFFEASLGEDLLGKVSDSRERPGLPPGAHLLAFFGAAWPWTVLVVMAAPFAWRWRRAPETAFLLGWIVPTWVVFELVATKLPHYTLPVYPAILALTAAAILDGGARPKGAWFWGGAILWAMPAVALPLAFAFGPSILEQRLVLAPMLVGLAALAALLAAWRWLLKGLWLGFVRAALLGATLTYVAAYQFGFPEVRQIWTSERMVAMAAPWRACAAQSLGERPALAAVRYHEPSLVFLAGTDTKLLQPQEAAAYLASAAGALVWVEARRYAPFAEAAAALGAAPRLLERTDGYQYNGGKQLDLSLYALDGDPAYAACGLRRVD